MVRFVDESTAEVLDMPAIEWLDVPAARAPYPYPSEPVGNRPRVAARNPFAADYVDPIESARWAGTPGPDAPAEPVEWAMPAEDGRATLGVESVTRWIAGAEVTVPRIVRRVRPPMRRIVRAARATVIAAATIIVGLAVLGIAIH